MADKPERRTEERFPVNAATSCTFAGPVAEDFGPPHVHNLSMKGIGLFLRRRVEPGALLAVSLSNQARSFAKTVLVRVIHASAQPGGCLVGGTFDTPLTYQELSTLVL